MKKLMKIGVGLTALVVFISSQESFGQISIENLKREDYVILDNVIGVAHSSRVWILFIPFGGTKKSKLREKAYKNALDNCHCDGVLQPVYSEKKIPIPLIVISYVYRKTSVTGKAYRIKTDKEK